MSAPSTQISMSSERQIENLIAAYAFRNDDADIEGLGDLFAEATFSLDGTVAHGKTEIETFAQAIIPLLPDGSAATSHEISNIIIVVDEDAGTATAQSYWTLYRAISGSPREAVLAGRYRDAFKRHEGVWRFSQRDAVSRWRAEG